MDSLIQVASQYGFPGLVILAFGWYIVHTGKIHREERKELTDVLAKQHEEALEVTKSNITVITELKTLISKGK